MIQLAENGAEALDLLQQQSFDLVLMDIQMPVMDGYEATRQLRSRGYTLPVIALTAAAMAEDQQKALACGMNGHLAKPIDTHELQQVLARWLKAAETKAATAADVPPAPSAVVKPKLGSQAPLLDTESGLALLGGNGSLYAKLLDQFQQQLQQDYPVLLDKLQALTPASATDDFTAAQKLAHSLKGVAGNLALKQMAQLATELDRLLKRAEVPPASLIQDFAKGLEQTAESIQQWLMQEQTPDPVKTAIPMNSGINSQSYNLEVVLQTLQKAVQNSEFIDDAELTALGEQLPADCQSLWLQLSSALDNFDFEQANQQLIQLLDQVQRMKLDV